jgi:DNA-binding NtrC family response regulator
MREIFGLIEQIAPSNVSVLITGESGTGKELVARTLHELSPRKPRPFVAVNCAAIPETLIESEIFGHEKGAFTGAVERRAGCFELARAARCCWTNRRDAAWHAGQAAARAGRAQAAPAGRAHRAGCGRARAGRHQPRPRRGRAEGHLRADLYYRLNVFNIHMPPLREHMEDLPAMAEAMLKRDEPEAWPQGSGVAPSMLDRMMAYDWPGNARELRNTIERAVILCPMARRSMWATCRRASARRRASRAARGRQHGAGARRHDRGRGRAAADSAHAGSHRDRTRPAPPRFWASA